METHECLITSHKTNETLTFLFSQSVWNVFCRIIVRKKKEIPLVATLFHLINFLPKQ